VGLLVAGLADAAGVGDEARALPWPPADADASFVRQQCLAEMYRLDESLAAGEHAAAGALASRRDDLACEAFLHLAFVVGHLREHAAEARPWIDLAEATSHRIGAPARLEARRERVLAAIADSAVDKPAVLEHAQKALAIDQRSGTAEDWELAQDWNGVGNGLSRNGRNQEALEALRRARALFERLAGRNSTSVSMAWRNEANPLYDLGRVDEALQALQHALDIDERILGRDHAVVGNTLISISDCLCELRRFEALLPVATRAEAVARKNPEQMDIGVPVALRYQACAQLGLGHAAQARRLMDQARSAGLPRDDKVEAFERQIAAALAVKK
jgi:tetratricopeptide (TPR) repeat protein